MNKKYVIGIIAVTLCSLFLIIISMWRNSHTPVVEERLIVHPISPFASSISGVGIIEASSENIFIGSSVHRIVDRVTVKAGMKVKRGDVLFKLEDRDLQADLKARQVEFEIAEAKLKKLEAMPRPEDVAPAEASLRNNQAALDQAKSQYEMILQLKDSRAISQEESNRRRFNLEQAEAQVQLAQADLNKIKEGVWKPDLEIARLEVSQAKANVERVKADVDRTIVRSPIDGTVLQIKIHEGEFPPSDSNQSPMMILGNVDELRLRVSINQFDAPYFKPTAAAVAFLRGDARKEFPLQFLRVEPLLVSKQNLTNQINEKVDTQVLQVIYSIQQKDASLFVGQQMDVFIETKRVP